MFMRYCKSIIGIGTLRSRGSFRHGHCHDEEMDACSGDEAES